MPVLHLGVIDIAYVQQNPPAPKGPKGKPTKRVRKRAGPHKLHEGKYLNVTTGDVAEILEAKYGVMQAYFDHHENDIAKSVENSLLGAVESLVMGAPPQMDPWGSATSAIEDGFKQFLSTKEIETLGIPGVPTMAAQMGISHRLKNPGIRSRHSFK